MVRELPKSKLYESKPLTNRYEMGKKSKKVKSKCCEKYKKKGKSNCKSCPKLYR